MYSVLILVDQIEVAPGSGSLFCIKDFLNFNPVGFCSAQGLIFAGFIVG